MSKLLFCAIFLALLAHTAAAESVITIEVNQSGNAFWTMEKRLPLTPPEINEWDAMLKTGQNISRPQDIEELKDTIDLFMSTAQNFSNRSMKVENLTVSYDTLKTMSGGFGIIRFNFLWNNFSRTESDKIHIGDAFPMGFVLSAGNVLVVKIPDHYEVESVSPKFDRQDGNMLIWEGTLYPRFGKEEPELVLSPEVSPEVINQETLPTWSIIIAALVVLLFGILLIFWKRRQNPKYKNLAPESKDGTDMEMISDYTDEKSDTAALTSELTEEEYLGDEELIEKFLTKSGGQAFQTDIVKDIGFSKSKISIVLARMKEEGRIIKIKKGKENIIRLAVKK